MLARLQRIKKWEISASVSGRKGGLSVRRIYHWARWLFFRAVVDGGLSPSSIRKVDWHARSYCT